MFRRILAIAFIFGCTTVAWLILGATIFNRTYSSSPALRAKVATLWGTPQEQTPPVATAGSVNLPLNSTHLQVGLDLDYRQKGLLWYSTYRIAFSGIYGFRNDTDKEQPVVFALRLPADRTVYDGIGMSIDGKPVAVKRLHAPPRLAAEATVAAGATARFQVSYRSQGLDSWRYNFDTDVAEVRDFSLRLKTNFRDIDFPENSLSPTSKEEPASGWILNWDYQNLVTGYQIAVAMPEHAQPGPLAGQISYFAPVSLFFFFFVMLVITTLRRIDLHPMNYFFLAAAFFAFHLLLAYLVDHMEIYLAFVISSAISIALVVSYLRLVTGMQFAAREAGLAQFIYLVLFSAAFFLKGFTGLSITIGAILTLFITMQVTGRVEWSKLFQVNRHETPIRTAELRADLPL